MVSVQEAELIISQNLEISPAIRVPLSEAFGCILRQDIAADRDVPPFHRVAMDGIAILFSSWQDGNLNFVIEGIQKAGSPVLTLKDPKNCFEVTTGAMLPNGCDCVIPVENIIIEGDVAKLREGFKLSPMQNVHRKGSDNKEGDVLLSKGAVLLSPQIAAAASVGQQNIQVSQSPKIAVVGTGDELVDINEMPAPYQIRQSNAYAIQSALILRGFRHVHRFHIKDDEKELHDGLHKMLEDFDFVILSGGVSMGKFDFVPQVLNELGVKVLFHKVKQRPGKPFWFGKNIEGKLVFALPGNPVSTQICFYRYVMPHLIKSLGIPEHHKEYAILATDVEIKTSLRYFQSVKIQHTHDGRIMAEPVYLNGSGDYASLARSDGFVELEESTHHFPKGTIAPLYRWKI